MGEVQLYDDNPSCLDKILEHYDYALLQE